MTRPRILALSSRVPFPLAGGDRLRVYHVVRALQEAGDVELLCLSEGPADRNAIAHLRSLLTSVTTLSFPPWRYRSNAFSALVGGHDPLQVGYYRFADVRAWVDDALTRCDLAFAFHVRMTEYLRSARVPRIVDLVDAISLNYRRARGHGLPAMWRAIYHVEIPRLEAYEARVTRLFDRSYVVAEADRAHLVGLGADAGRLVVLENGTDSPPDPAIASRSEDIDLVFIGNMETQSNRAAVTFFVSEVLPIFRSHGESPSFYVVGVNPGPETRKLADGRQVFVTGAVEDPSAYVRRAKVVVAPMVFGAGVQNKILEGMALGKPVVTTSIGAAGLDAQHGVHLLVEDTPAGLAGAIRRCLADEALRRTLGRAAAARMRERYSWDRMSAQVRLDVAALLHRPSLTRSSDGG